MFGLGIFSGKWQPKEINRSRSKPFMNAVQLFGCRNFWHIQPILPVIASYASISGAKYIVDLLTTIVSRLEDCPLLYNKAMSFQAYIDNIEKQTGKTPEQLKNAAEQAGVFKRDMKAGELVAFLKKEFNLGHGHCMAIWKYFKDKGWVDTK